MTKEELIELLEKSEDKYSIFTSYELIAKCTFPEEEFLALMKQYLTNEQKLELFNNNYFAKRIVAVKHPENPHISFGEYMSASLESTHLLASITDYHMLMEVMTNVDLVKRMSSVSIVYDVMPDEAKISLLGNLNLMKSAKLNPVELLRHISADKRKPILLNKDYLIDELNASFYSIGEMAREIQNDDFITEFIKAYSLETYQLLPFLSGLSAPKKKEILLEDTYHLSSFHKKDLLRTFEVEALISFVNENPDFLNNSAIEFFEISRSFDREKTEELMKRLGELELDDVGKRMIIAMIPEEIKTQMNRENIPSELQSALDITVSNHELSTHLPSYRIDVDLNSDLTKYQVLGKYLYINGEELSSDEKEKLYELRYNLS